MCRLAAFPPMFPKDCAAEILKNMEGWNKDGTGSVYVKDREFVINKWPKPLGGVLATGMPLLDHMPHPGWTVVHLRMATHGAATAINTHPFIKRDLAVVHNGVFSDYDKYKKVLAKHAQFDGQTDSEVAAYLMSILKTEDFMTVVENSGVFLGLRRDGSLMAVNCLGDLEFCPTSYGTVISSRLPETWKKKIVTYEGWLKLNKQGAIVKSNYKKGYKVWTNMGHGWGVDDRYLGHDDGGYGHSEFKGVRDYD